MTTVSIQEAESKLADLIHQLQPGDEVVITENQRPVAKLVGQGPDVIQPRKSGSAKGKLTILQEDDEHLEDFAGYMP